MYKIIVMDNIVEALRKLPEENKKEIQDSFICVNKIKIEDIAKNSNRKENIKLNI